ncbi:hypothetical protein CEXT_37561 [Caerostris extrusa]|uniref:Uncharacterized protein n=1 Tax=Caerostris extrusa TaxID=172846 RepID=A0AAV4WBV5_CAEEX|nr:hypothetical protein CEXT_37561 [Caerostris extrusa]
MQKLPEALKMPFIQSLYTCHAAPSEWKTAGVHLNSPINRIRCIRGSRLFRRVGFAGNRQDQHSNLTGFGFFLYWPSRKSNHLGRCFFPGSAWASGGDSNS